MAVAADYVFRHRPLWPATVGIGKTVVTSQLLDRVAAALPRPLLEMPVGFKWFSRGLLDASLGFCGEESAGAAFLRRDGTAWTTDKDGITAGLLAAEMTARCQRDPGQQVQTLVARLGQPFEGRLESAATSSQRARLAELQPSAIASAELAGEPIAAVLNRAPGNGEPIGGIKVVAASGWYAARPSGTEPIYKIYAESFQGSAHLHQLLVQAQSVVNAALR